MLTYHFEGTESDLSRVLESRELQDQVIVDIRFVNQNDPQIMPRIEVDAYDNPDGNQVILPTASERLQAAETLINLILDEEGE